MAKWYILHTVSGSEKGVKKMIEDQVVKKKMSDYFEDVVVPVIEVPEIKRGKKVMSEKKFMPGYVLIKMKMTDDSWHLVKSVPKTTGFLGSKTQPQALSDAEVEAIFKKLEAESKSASSTSIYNAGDKVQIIDGPFDSFTGVVEEVDIEGQKLKVSVSIFGKATPIELSFTQVKKV
ncbi:MAG: transcription termination/antitermination protein NusG [Rickettsiales bacterium]|nr:transcription termination/antitermination protein NusG [Rickettsiales bacterium]MCA0254445.1 transcription termination/antitermination protein NusG [Pseudomonadota bacterium]